jgi:hypothetical protein
MITSLVAAACSGGTKTAAPQGSASGVNARPRTAPASLDTGRLRVSIAGWKTDFSRANVDLADFLGGGPPKDGIPAIDAPRAESIAAG